MAIDASKIEIPLEPRLMDTLERIARDEGKTPQEIAAGLLSHTLERCTFEPGEIEALLDEIPGFYERLQESRAQARAGLTTPLADVLRE